MHGDPLLEELIAQLGDFGTYQLRQHFLHLLSAFLAGIHMLSLTMVSPTPNHRCFIKEIDNGTAGGGFDIAQLANYIPLKGDALDKCHKYELVNNVREVVSCGGKFIYDSTYYPYTKVKDWDLVCEKRWERSMHQSVYMFGVLIGAILLGSLADKYGRKTIFCISGVCQLIAGLVTAFIPNFYLYTGSLFFYGMFGSGGAYVTGFVLSMELIGGSKRTICGTMFSAAFAVGVMVVAFWGYVIKDPTTLQVVYALHALCIVGHWWLIDESVRWLWGQGRKEEGIAIIRKGVKVNKLEISEDFEDKIREQGLTGANVEQLNHGTADLFRTPNLRKRMLNIALNWFANSLVYYGLSLNSGSLLGNPFLVLFFIGLAEIPGYITVMLFVDKTGRRCLCSSLMTLGGVACIIVAFIPKGWFVTMLTLIGKMAIAGSFAIAYNYTAELFPTVVRNSAIGIGAMSARFSGMLTPLIGLLDTLDFRVPTITFGCVALLAAFLALFLPETVRKQMPQSLEDGENFGRGDTGFRTLKTCLSNAKDEDEEMKRNEKLLNSPTSPA